MKNFPERLTNGNGVPMTLDRTRLLLAFRRPLDPAELAKLLAPLELALENGGAGEQGTGVPHERINHTRMRFWVQARTGVSDQHYERIESALTPAGLDWIGPVYRLAGERGRRAMACPLPASIMVRLRPREGVAELPPIVTHAATTPKLEEVAEKSRYLNGLRYFTIANAREVNAYEVKRQLEGMPLVADVQFETMPMVTPTAVNPSDTLYAQQWDMTRIDAGGAGQTGWDLSTGNAVVVCVLDEGVDLTHPDLRFSGNGINLGSMSGDGSPTGNHGTACAGIVAAVFDNMLGVAGVAGNARILPVAFDNWTDTEVAAGINWATANGATIISMSFGWNAWSHAVIDPAIAAAFAADVVMCVATHNHNGAITYPATHPSVMAVGASDQADNRKSPASPDGENWGSNFGPEISVVAPGVLIPTTDRQGSAGYNNAAGTAGDYMLNFNGTSSATPHVAGMAALIRAFYPALTNVQVRTLIERTTEKVGTVAYNDVAGYPSGNWNQEMGYGRINVLRALDEADVMIRDAPSDTGTEPFTGGNFWDFSDIVVRITDDNVFVPADPLQSKNVERGQANYIYVRVTNNGPRAARNVTVNTRITPFVGLQFVYPQDWQLVDLNHVNPTPVTASFAAIPPGGSVIAKFRIEAAQTEILYGWVAGHQWHPCLLAEVNADNDYAWTVAPLTGDPISAQRNNLAQRNLSVIDVLANAPAAFHFIMGNRFNLERSMGLTIDRSRLPAGMPLLLSIDDDGSAFPQVKWDDLVVVHDPDEDICGDRSWEFTEKTRIRTRIGCCEGVLVLEKGSRFECPPERRPGKVVVTGGDVIVRGGRRYVEVKGSMVHMTIAKAPGAMYPMSLHTTIPAGARAGDQFMVDASQQDARGVTVGGAGMVWVVE